MAFHSLAMTVVENSWNISTAVGKYLIIGLVLISIKEIGLSKMPEAIRKATNNLLLDLKEYIVYGMALSGIIATVTNITAGIIAGAGVTIYVLYKAWKGEEEEPDEPGGILEHIGYIFQLAAVLLSLAAIISGVEILNSLTALYIYVVIFWHL